MRKIVECVPNFSEGRNQTVIEEIVSTLRGIDGCNLVNYEADQDYNRTVVTLIGEPEAIIKALLPFVGKVLELIDMNVQKGEHPRMGAVDVIPFIPIEHVTMEECVEYANQVGQLIYDTYQIPSFLYANAATKKDRVKLPTIRKGEFEGMKDKIKDPHWTPDFGTNEIHPTFGVIGIGARIPLIAYNIDLDTTDMNPAKQISRAIRFSSGGFRHIQAGPVYLESRKHTQVTMNILDYTKNPIYRILETVKMEAAQYHVDVPSCELVGLIPKQALLQSLKYYFKRYNQPWDADMSFDDIVKYSIQYIGFRDFDRLKIIEANIN
ncbi:glutamate formimidoyltransferase [Candidatus Xianfuyuplasma coldseepsis]|uniref:glutamate formimidoyltransferase n=1 Tax=Candidatus Xianfuyuplasma coldseepsis TaxID=2782163 RepID=A0A7L7KQ06_9MOLU|nr:glutamate formimidoyltransferase [Xianfuyuplasma coldseepsis]QMS84803.1 glutamate formimidoyltransferase [Xianfuyuplasma coldseepsis]